MGGNAGEDVAVSTDGVLIGIKPMKNMLPRRAVPIYNSNLKSASRGGKASGSRPAYSQQDRPLPPSYVCYRCGTKGLYVLF